MTHSQVWKLGVSTRNPRGSFTLLRHCTCGVCVLGGGEVICLDLSGLGKESGPSALLTDPRGQPPVDAGQTTLYCPSVLCPLSSDAWILSSQIVWATTNRIGCAVNTCRRMNVWGEAWENAVYLVCNYSPK